MGAKKWTNLDENVSGIYQIKNLVNGKIYIGQSVDIRTRWWQHKSQLRLNKHINTYLQNSWNKYGEDNFEFSVIEFCEIDKLDEREIYWINKKNTLNPIYGYNANEGGGGNRGATLTEEQKEYMSKVKNPEEVVQIDFDGNFVKVWRSATHAQRTLENIRARSILQCCRHVTSQANGYIWFFKKEYEKIENFDVEQYKFQNKRFFDLPILQYDLYGNLIKEWLCSELSQEKSFNYNVIRKCCNHQKCTYNNYIWKFKYDKDFVITEEFLRHCRKTTSTYLIDQFDKDMNFIKTWTTTELKENEYDICKVNQACRGEYKCETYKNYIWKEHIGAI